MSDYVKIKAGEMSYGETNLLESQLSLVSLLKQYNEYVTLRKEELFLKIDLKKKIGEASEFLDKLSKVLPESRLLEEEKIQREIAEKIEGAVQKSKNKEWKYWTEKGTKSKKDKTTNKKDKPELSLDEELEEIRKKLERLQ